MKNPEKRKAVFNFDSILALASILIALFLINYQYNMPRSAVRQALGPSFVPIALLIALILTAIALFFKSIHAERKADVAVSALAEPETKTSAKQKKIVIMILLGLLIYAAILTPVGFIISTIICINYQAQLFEKGKWVRNLVVSVPFSFLVYYVFVYLLEITLPAGILEILAP
jgi:putative tricarboxylic transport membrane protein